MLTLTAVGTGCTLASLDNGQAQQPAWRPQRIAENSAAQPLKQQPLAYGSSAQQANTQFSNTKTAASDSDETQVSGVVLRWKKNASSQQLEPAHQAGYPTAARGINPTGITSQSAFDQPANNQRQLAFNNTNPLRGASHASNESSPHYAAVRLANFQEDVTADPFGDNAPMKVPAQDVPTLPDINLPSIPGNDPLLSPEPAPAPSSIMEQAAPNPFGRRPQGDSSASDLQAEQGGPQTDAALQFGLDLPNRDRKDPNSLSCDDQRDRIRNRPLTDVSLDVSPSFGEGLRSVTKDAEEQRLDFAANSAIRDWSDYTGQVIARGRLIDLRDDRVVLDVEGREQTILVQKLSDVDVAYVSESWTLPIKCGTGNASYIGRNFIPSAAQWKAPGNCHKPAYFEQPQLERYGHEVGPVLQPLLSTAHFFGNIAVLPYKMGIHPPNECQYSLGYLRPGNCAPYMLQPIPLSLRGAAVQAGFVTGAVSLLP